MIDPIEDLVKRGPWPVQALCIECGSEHTSMALTRLTLERLAKLSPHGTCRPCVSKDEDEVARLSENLQNVRGYRSQETIPTRADVSGKHRVGDRDGDDPFDDRADLW